MKQPALSLPDCLQLPPSPFLALTALVSFTAEGESQPDPGRGDTPPSTPIQFHPTRENVPGGWLGKNKCSGAGLQHSARGEAESHGAPGLQTLHYF